MIRGAELAIFLAPLLAFVLWRVALARGLAGPPPAQLVAILVGLLLMGAGLAVLAGREALPPGRYVPAHLEGGRIIAGHSE